jgi:TPR repeat protein
MSTQKETSLAASIKEKAVSGDVAAQRRLAAIYEQGFGVPQDYVQEAFWYRKAAEQGDADSQNNLGGLYEAGQGVRQSFTEAAFWYRKAAIQGNSTAHYNLGLLYSNGHGASRSNVEAYFWLDVAAATIKGKEPPAAAVRDIVAAKLSPTELSEAQERAAKWFVVEHPAPPASKSTINRGRAIGRSRKWSA